MPGRYPARHVDADPGWVQRRFREVDQRISELRTGKLSAVPGSTVTIQQILTDPAGVLGFLNTDTKTAAADAATVILPLTHRPIDGSLHVRQNGLNLAAAEWTRVSQRVTIEPTANLVVRAGDVFDAAYAFDPSNPGVAIVPTWRATAPQNLNAFLDPTAIAEVGDLLVAVAMMPSTESITALNGWSPGGVSDYVTHAAIGAGTRTYRLEIYYTINDGTGTVPTVSTVSAEDVVGAMSAFENGSAIEAVFDTLADGTAANAPELPNASLRIWGTIGDTITITPGRGDVVLSTNYLEIDIAMTVDADPSAAPATATGTAGWCLASLAVTA